MKKFNTTSRNSRLVFAILFLIIQGRTFGQTFVNTPTYPYYISTHHDTLNVGPLSLSSTKDHKVWGLIRVDQDEITHLIKYDSTGHQLVNIQITQSYTLSTMYTTEIYACPDNGCVFGVNRVHSAPFIEGKVYRCNPSGSYKWVIDFNPNNNPNITPYVFAVKPTYYNTTLILLDSLIEVDSAGHQIRSRQSFLSQPYLANFLAIPDSELIVINNGIISREFFDGTTTWTTPGYGNLLYADSDYFYAKSTDTIIKYRTIDGTIVWQKIIPAYFASVKKDGGLLTCGDSSSYYYSSDKICNYDSAGNLIWCQTINSPMYGYRRIVDCTPNSFITGGATPCFTYDFISLNHATGAFVASVDSLGHGVIDSTHHFVSGNANDNFTFGFVDDGPFIAAAIGTNGIPRCPVNQNTWNFNAVFNTDWSTQFGAGINHKYSDVNGDGTIDIQDLNQFQNIPIYPHYSVPHWRLSSQTQTGPSLVINVEEDSIIAGDTVTVHIILGDSLVPIDSIYSLAIAFQSDNLFYGGGERLIVPNSDFGDPSTDLLSFRLPQTNADFTNVLLCKTNHQNVMMFRDTIATFRIPTSSGRPSRYYNLTPFINAITKEGFPVTLGVISDSVYYSDPLLNINSVLSDQISIYPNPASDILTISNKNNQELDLNIYDVTGRIFYTGKTISNETQIKLDAFPEGTYFIQLNTERGVSNKSFIILR